MENLHDKILIESILDGKTEAFEPLIRKHQRPVFALIRPIVSCREDAEELTQDVFVKVFQKLNSFKGNSSFSTGFFALRTIQPFRPHANVDTTSRSRMKHFGVHWQMKR